MERAIGSVAAGLGHLVRFVLSMVPWAFRAVALGLIVYGITLFDVRLGCIAAGVLLLLVIWPRPKETR